MNTPQTVPSKTLIQLPTKQELERIQSNERINLNSLEKQFEKRKIIPKRLDNSVKSLSVKTKKQLENSNNKFDISNSNLHSNNYKSIVPPEKLMKIIAPLKRHKSNKSNKK